MTKDESAKMESLEVEIHLGAEMDEFWSFACTSRSTSVGNKSNQRWTWYAIERKSGIILAWHNGKRRDCDFWVLWHNFRLLNTTQMIGILTRNTFLRRGIAQVKTILGRLNEKT